MKLLEADGSSFLRFDFELQGGLGDNDDHAIVPLFGTETIPDSLPTCRTTAVFLIEYEYVFS